MKKLFNIFGFKKKQKDENYKSYTVPKIKEFRETIISGKLRELNSLTRRYDFYSLSSCRDLCFHEQEHIFTVKQLQETLQSNGLKFLGFVLPQQVKSLYKQYFLHLWSN